MKHKAKSTKQIAQRIDPAYHRRPHPLRRLRTLLSMVLFAAAALYAASGFAPGRKTVFSNGPVADSHRFIESDCAACHAERFGPVHDASCVRCHDAWPHLPVNSERSEPSCVACHREHGGDELMRGVTDRHCNDCHEAHRSIMSLDDHIQFERVERDQYLRFNHEKHLAKELVGGELTCGSCHQPPEQGPDFAPIRFAEHCSRCHAERVADDVGGVVPHGVQPAELGDWVAAIFVRQALKDEAVVGRTEGTVPGRGGAKAPEWAKAIEARTASAMAALLHRGRGCLLCHVLDEDDRIRPPTVFSNWYPRANFNHKTHRFESCDFCHDMSRNRAAETLDVPGVETCRKCHSDTGANNSCRTCHPYHPRDTTEWR